MSLLRAAKLNAISNYVNFAVSSLVTIAVSPLLLSYLGPAGFGTWKSLQRLMDFGTVADGRAMQALKWVIAKNARRDCPEQNRQAVGSAILVWLLFLPLTAIAATLIVFFAPDLIRDASVSDSRLQFVGALLAFNLFLVPLLGIPDSVLVGVNKGFASMTIQTGTLILANLGMLLVSYLGFGLVGMAAVVLVSTAFNAVVIFFRARALVDWFGIAKPARGATSRFFSFSGWVLFWSLISKLLLSTEILLLGALVGASMVADFTFTAYAPQFAIAICFMTGSAAMPGIGSLMAGEMSDSLVKAIDACRSVVLAMATILCCGIVLFNQAFVTLWAGPQRYLGDTSNLLLVVSAFQLILIRNEAQIQDLTLSIRSKVLLGALGALLSLAIGYAAFVLLNGRYEAIFGGIILGRGVLSWLFPRMVRGIVLGQASRWKTVLLSVLTIAACSMSAAWIERLPMALSLRMLATVGVLSVAIWFVLAVLLEHDTRRMGWMMLSGAGRGRR